MNFSVGSLGWSATAKWTWPYRLTRLTIISTDIAFSLRPNNSIPSIIINSKFKPFARIDLGYLNELQRNKNFEQSSCTFFNFLYLFIYQLMKDTVSFGLYPNRGFSWITNINVSKTGSALHQQSHANDPQHSTLNCQHQMKIFPMDLNLIKQLFRFLLIQFEIPN